MLWGPEKQVRFSRMDQSKCCPTDIQHTQCQSSENRREEQRLICDLTDRKPRPLPFWLLSFQLGQQLCLQWGQQLLHHQVSQHLQRDRGSHYWSQWYQPESRHKTPTWPTDSWRKSKSIESLSCCNVTAMNQSAMDRIITDVAFESCVDTELYLSCK